MERRSAPAQNPCPHIVFEVDGTLLDTEYARLHALRDMLQTAAGTRLPVDSLRFALGMPAEDALRQLGVKNRPAACALWAQNLARYRHMVSLFPGIAGVLHRLARAGCTLGIAAGQPCGELWQDFSRFGVEGCFSMVICTGEAPGQKPSPAPLLEYCGRAGIAAGQLLYVGSTPRGSERAARAGCAFALAMWGGPAKSPPAQYYLPKPESLLELFL